MILFLDNNIFRANKSQINFEKYKDIAQIIISDDKCNKKLDEFLENKSSFDEFDTIIIHESIYKEEQREKLFKVLKNYCKDKKLVKFSGNNSYASFTNSSLQLSDIALYMNLEVFFKEYENNNSNILMLAYGQNWSINKLLNTLQGIHMFIENYKDEGIDFDEFESDYDLLYFKKILSIEEYKILFKNFDNLKDEIDLKQVKVLASNLKILIQEKSNG